MKQTIKPFLVIQDKTEVNMAQTGNWVVEDGFPVYPHDIIPLIHRGVGCLATVRVVATETGDKNTKVFFSFVDTPSSSNPSRLATYYEAYCNWEEDNGRELDGEDESFPIALLPLGTHVFLTELAGQAVEIKATHAVAPDGTKFDYVGLPVPFCDGTAVYFQHDEIAAVSAAGDHLLILDKLYGEPIACCPSAELERAMEQLPTGNYSAKQIPQASCPICKMKSGTQG